MLLSDLLRLIDDIKDFLFSPLIYRIVAFPILSPTMFSRVNSILLAFCFASLSSASTLSQFNQEFSAQVKEQLKHYNIPGAAYAIVQNNNIIALENFGHTDKKKSHHVDNNTVFRLASVSKTFAATITTMLAQEQKLKLSDPITKYVPNFVLATDGAAQKIQLKHLLSHSTGLMPNAFDNLLHENWDMEKIIGRFNRIAPICQPQKCYGYQNIAYGMLQPAIEASQNKSYAAILQERVFNPLKMTHASVGINVYKEQENTAKPHILRKRINTGKKDQQGQEIKKYVWRTVKVTQDYYKVAPAAGVNASITDLAKWLIANLGHNPEVLTPTLLTELTTPRIRTKKDLRRRFWRDYLTDAHYGYGWRIYQFKGKPIIYHSGWVAGFRADIGYSPDLNIGFAMVINAESNAINKISSQFWSQANNLFAEPL
ncbi:serine hydrolase domain-containing protein [Colwellia psychrerythraea]|uniref:Beta-lactamase n=1 Tax=Colwellia psychrerythraea TaxID=28229 RepID=A0A099L3A9_COLPS|nr:serine hydrolase domain-containing protein [Colwellia psychrerythraea]KGJ96930.1 beta-lactamase [Colwellia psychrerythraea]